MDSGMLANASQTDLHEVLDLLGWRMLLYVLGVVALPAFVLWHVRLVRTGFLSQLWRNAVLLLAAAALATVGIVSTTATSRR